MKTDHLVSVLEVDGVLFSKEQGKHPIDESMLVHVAKYFTWDSKEDILEDGQTPRECKIKIAIYIEDK